MGCGSSVPIASSLGQKKSVPPTSGRLPPIKRDEKSLPKSTTRPSNLEPLTLVCFDDHFLSYRKELQSIIDDFHSFAQLDQCEEFLTDPSQQSACIFLLISSKSFVDLLSRVQHLPQVDSIYLLDEHQRIRVDPQWKRRYPKVKGVYSDHGSLLEQLSSDVSLALNLNDFIPLTVYNRLDAIQSHGTSTDHLRFLFYQLFFQQYCLNAASPLNHTDIFEVLRPYYAANRRQAKLVEQFNEDYDPSADVIHWWVEGTFLRRLLTRALKEMDMSMLFKVRFFIRDLFKSMINQSSSTGNKSNGYGRLRMSTSNEQIFYRGQALAKDNFLKIKSNLGEILSLNDFFLANRTRQNSLKVLKDHVPLSDLVYRVLFELKMPSDYSLQKQRPFVHLHSAKKSADDDEREEILFCAGSIFRINNAVFDINHDTWIVQLTLYDEHVNEDFSPMFNFLRQSKQSTTVLANLLRQISPQSAEQFYKHVLKETSSHSHSKIECYRGLGLCSYSRNDYDQALQYFHQALQCKSSEELVQSSLHHDLGLVYAQQNESEQALKHFRQALEHCSLPLHRACVHHNIALVHSQQGEHQEELENYEEALQIRSRQLPNQHLQLASLQNNIGIAYSDLQQYDRALENLRTALESRLKLLTDSHIDVARSYANIGTVYGKTKEYRMALEYFNKAHLLFEKQSQLPEGDLEQLDRNIKLINDKLRRKTY